MCNFTSSVSCFVAGCWFWVHGPRKPYSDRRCWIWFYCTSYSSCAIYFEYSRDLFSNTLNFFLLKKDVLQLSLHQMFARQKRNSIQCRFQFESWLCFFSNNFPGLYISNSLCRWYDAKQTNNNKNHGKTVDMISKTIALKLLFLPVWETRQCKWQFLTEKNDSRIVLTKLFSQYSEFDFSIHHHYCPQTNNLMQPNQKARP